MWCSHPLGVIMGFRSELKEIQKKVFTSGKETKETEKTKNQETIKENEKET